jgi:hypothetical protein
MVGVELVALLLCNRDPDQLLRNQSLSMEMDHLVWD